MVNLKDLEKIFRSDLLSILGVSDNALNTPVRLSWPTNGQTDWKIDEDVMFLQLTDEGGADIAQTIDTYWEDADEDLNRVDCLTRVLKLTLIAYGPNSYDHLVAVRFAMMVGRDSLKSNNLFIVPEPAAPQRAPELFQGRWWERSDLVLTFNHLTEFTAGVKTIKSVDVTVDANKPGESEEIISETISGIKVITNS